MHRGGLPRLFCTNAGRYLSVQEMQGSTEA